MKATPPDSTKQNAIAALEDAALEQLRATGCIGSGVDMCSQLIKVLIQPSFESYKCYCVSKGTEGRYFGFRTIWRRDLDLQIFEKTLWIGRKLEPTFEKQTVELEPTFVQGALEKLRTLQLPVLSQNAPLILDGTRIEVTLTIDCTSTFLWNTEAPPEWKLLEEITNQIIDHINTNCSEQTATETT